MIPGSVTMLKSIGIERQEGRIEEIRRRLTRIISVCFVLYTVVEANSLMFPPFQERSLFLMFALVLCFLRPRSANNEGRTTRNLTGLLELLLATMSVLVCAYIVLGYKGLLLRMGAPTHLDLLLGSIAIVLVMEATRRSTGWALPVTSILFLLYAYGGSYLPGYLGGHGGYDLERIITQSYLTMEGIFGIALYVMFSYVFLFILFGTVLETIGGLGYAVNLAQTLLGQFAGGPAKVAVVASGLVGMISGSAVANAVTAGSLTIPMMKKAGFQPHIAGAIEAVASTGGQLMPPVMGAAAFLMAEFLGVPYTNIAKAALIPAILYYIALFATVHFHSVRYGIRANSGSNVLSEARQMIKRKELFLFLLPLVCLVVLLIYRFTPTRAVSYAILTAVATSLAINGRRVGLGDAIGTLEKTAIHALSLSSTSACVGIIIGITLMTGLGSRFSTLLVDWAAGNVIVALLLVMVSSILLGLGLPTTICYILLATLAAPALVRLGIPPLAAHMFIFYFGMMSMVTPPDAMAAYAAATIAGADMMKTGFTAWLFSLAGYVLPFVFVFSPSLLMIGSRLDILFTLCTATVGVIILGAALAGHLKGNLRVWERLLLVCASVALVKPGYLTDILGFGLLVVVLLRQYRSVAQPARRTTYTA